MLQSERLLLITMNILLNIHSELGYISFHFLLSYVEIEFVISQLPIPMKEILWSFGYTSIGSLYLKLSSRVFARSSYLVIERTA